MSSKKLPAYRAYTVDNIDDVTSFWTLIGAAFAHEDMKGFNVLLKALPIDGRLVLRRYTEPQPQKTAEVVEVAKPTPKKSADQNA